MSKQSQYHSRWKQFKMSASERRHRRFSASFKRAKVAEIARGVTKICEVVKQYEVSSRPLKRVLPSDEQKISSQKMRRKRPAFSKS